MYNNDYREILLGENDALPSLHGEKLNAGKLEAAPGVCTFIML